MEERSELEKRKQTLGKELSDVEAELLKPSQKTICCESKWLLIWFWIIVGTLCVTLVASLLALLFLPETYAEHCGHIYALAALAGIAGSSVSALVSVNARYAAGLEFKDGTRYPDQEKKERFNSRLVAGFLTRPLLGGATGPLIILALRAKIFGDVDLSNPEIVLLWSALGGLFAKTLLDKLKDVFANLIGARR